MSATAEVLATTVIDGFVVPIVPNIHQRVYAAASQPGALDMLTWHCGSVHCRAGHTVDQAGPQGYDLVRQLALAKYYSEYDLMRHPLWANDFTFEAANLIYVASSAVKPMNYFANSSITNEDALTDMKRCADEEAALARGESSTL